MKAGTAGAELLAARHPAPDPGLFAQPGTIAFLVIFGLGVVLFFVFRSMARHLRRVNQAARDETQARFEREQAKPDGGPPGNGPATGPGS